jgi:hypothetical protein
VSVRGIVVLIVAILAPLCAEAQQARPSPLAIDSAISVDQAVDSNGNFATGVFADSVVSFDIGRGMEAIVWPIVQRLGSGDRMADVWIAALRYERAGRVGLRLDGGLIPSPIGLANLTVRRPHLNPLISQPASLFSALPALEFRGPRANLLGAIYPFGGQVTVSGAHWDARAAVIDTSPLRRRRILSQVNPPRFANLVAGAGFTPMVGLRVGVSVAQGGWARAGESPAVTEDRDATVVAVETEFSFRYTKLAGEWVRDRIEIERGDEIASGWFVYGQQTLSPRWFAAGRLERMSSPVTLPIASIRQALSGTEAVLGYRLTPEVTLRVGHRARRAFGATGFTHQVAVSAVFWKRWM